MDLQPSDAVCRYGTVIGESLLLRARCLLEERWVVKGRDHPVYQPLQRAILFGVEIDTPAAGQFRSGDERFRSVDVVVAGEFAPINFKRTSSVRRFLSNTDSVVDVEH